MIKLKLKNNFRGLINRGKNMSKNKEKIVAKNVEFKTELATQSQQVTQVDEIMLGNNTTSHNQIRLTVMMLNTIKAGVVKLEYKEKNKTTGIETNVKFSQLNTIENKHIRGFIGEYKKWLGVETDKAWQSTTEQGKERNRILKVSFWVCLPMIKTNALTTHDGEQFTGSKNSEIFVDGKFAKKWSDKNPKNLPVVSMKFADLKRSSQNYYKGDSDLSSNETASKDNSFQSLMKKSAIAIKDSKEKIVLGENHPNDLNAVKNVFNASKNYIEEFNNVQASLKKIA